MSRSAQPTNDPGQLLRPDRTNSTGPTVAVPATEAGLTASSQNTVKTALFAAGDFVHPREQEESDEMSECLPWVRNSI